MVSFWLIPGRSAATPCPMSGEACCEVSTLSKRPHVAFGIVWSGIMVAAALGNYPTPLVGYGGSAVLGYLLSLAALPAAARSGSRVCGQPNPDERPADQDGARMSLGTAYSS